MGLPHRISSSSKQPQSTKTYPFKKLSPGTRHRHTTFASLCSDQRPTLAPIEASPAIANQCSVSEKHLLWGLLVTDLDDYMVQDAVAIMLFPTQQRTGIFSNALRDHYRLWETCNLPNPLKSRDNTFSDQGQTMLSNLFNRLLIFIEDYLTKATAKNAAVEYSCLPDLSAHSRRQSCLGYSISTRFNAANLSSSEKKATTTSVPALRAHV